MVIGHSVPMNGRFPFVVIALFVFIGLSCAKQGYPPGGRIDKTAPSLIHSTPAQNSTSVSLTDPLIFEFSESMDEKSVEENLFIVPIPSEWPEFRWRSRSRVFVVTFKHSLQGNTTYVVTIGSKAQDEHRNTMEVSVTLCFSTGAVLENKVMKGCVVPYNIFNENREKVSAVDVIAYRLDTPDDPDPRNDVPDYFTQTGSDGLYEMFGLSRGSYRFFAVGDKDKDGFYTEGYDLVGVMPHDVNVADGDSIVAAPEMTLSARYTSDMQLTSIRASNNRSIELYFDRAVAFGSFSLEIEGLAVKDWFYPDENHKTVSAATEIQENKRKYTISKIEAHDIDGNKLAAFDTQPFFTGTDRPDTTSLDIVKWGPKLLSSPDEYITLVFNRILDLPADMKGVVKDDSGAGISVEKAGPNELRFTPLEQWRSNYNYIILFDTDAVKGAAGNRLSAAGSQLLFRSAPLDTLGSMEGTIEDLSGLAASAYHIILKNINLESIRKISFPRPYTWSSGPLLPGKYVCCAYKDVDGDGVVSRGAVHPFKAAEHFIVLQDTVTVEPRWPVKDINFIFH